MTVAQSLKTRKYGRMRSSSAMCWSRPSTSTIATQCDQILTGYFRASVGVVGMVSRRVPSLIKSITLVVPLLTLGATVRAPANSLHADDCALRRQNSPAARGQLVVLSIGLAVYNNANAGICARPTDRFDGARLQQPHHCVQLQFRWAPTLGSLMVLRYQWTPVMRLRPHPASSFQSSHRPRRRSLGPSANLSSKAYSKMAARRRRRRRPPRRLATRRLVPLSLPPRGPIPYSRVRRVRHETCCDPIQYACGFGVQ